MIKTYAGIVAPFLVLAVLAIAGATTPGYDPVKQTISELRSGFGGTSTVALYGFVLATCVWEPIVKALRPSLSSGVLVVSLLAVAAGCVGIALVAAEPWPWNAMGWQGRLHLIFAFVFVFAAIPVACAAAAGALPPARRGLRVYSLGMAIGLLAVLISTLLLLRASPPSAYAETHLGLIERAYVFSFLIWQGIFSARLVAPAR